MSLIMVPPMHPVKKKVSKWRRLLLLLWSSLSTGRLELFLGGPLLLPSYVICNADAVIRVGSMNSVKSGFLALIRKVV